MKGKVQSHLWQLQKKSREEDLPCAKCERVGLMTVDHIIPLSFLEMLGLTHESIDYDWNFQFLCRACNSLKRHKIDFTDERTIPLLKRILVLAEAYYQ